ncbi:MAG: GNAT family N-acetyltransferase [Acidobacteria bacterium]|nr:GNAT family N-acetyltransferase [Acidobacteriota bacterium]MBI3281731.1 GNAT family N-acetyltransferase [Acidobacteriota bacterium]
MLRLLTPADLPDLMELKAAAGWNQTERDWLMMLRLQPDGCFGIELDSHIVASTVALHYGELAWIAMVLTLPDYRGRGLARELMRRALEFSAGRPARLDASDMGRGLYHSLGFQDEYAVERWLRQPARCEPATVQPFRFDARVDHDVFGGDRGPLLRELALLGSAASLADGSYAIGRPGSRYAHFGPCVAQSPESARTLLAWFAAAHDGEPVTWDLPPANKPAAGIAREFAFEPVRHLTRMVLGASPQRAPDPRLYAIAGFELG